MDILNYLKNLFQNKQEQNQPLVHEVLQRDEDEISSYMRWKESPSFKESINLLREKYLDKAEEGISLDGFMKMDSPKTRAFMLSYHAHLFEEKEFQHLFDFLKEKTLLLGYRNYTSDVRNYLKKKGVETIERHYLKPAFQFHKEVEKVEQGYGNILIEHKLQDGKPLHIKYVSNTYSDRNYTEAKKFNELLSHLLS